MSKLFRYFSILSIQLVLINSIKAQDAVFSQYFASSLYLSPCFAGIEPNLNVGINTRTQWKSVTTPYVTNQISIIKPFYKYGLTDNNVGGVGLSVYQDKAGDFGFETIGANVSGAYNLNINENNTLTFGLRAGVIQERINTSQLQWGSQFDKYKGFNPDVDKFPPDQIQSSGSLSGSKTMLDLGAGLLYYYKAGRDRREKGMSLWLGYSGFHLNRPNESMVSGFTSRMAVLNKGLAGFEFTVGSRFNLSPNVLVVTQGQDAKDIKGLSNMQVNTGMYITYMLVEPESDMLPKDLIIGGWYRLGDSFIASVGLQSNAYTIGFSYDLNQSGLKTITKGKGAWEVSLKIQVPKKEKVKRYYTPRI